MPKKKGGFSHDPHYEGKSNDWITPKYIIDAFGFGWFDLDPCASINQPWPCARKAFTEEQNGLKQKWFGNVWCNPPYGPHTKEWINYLSKYGEGVAFIFARTDTALWQKDIFTTADGYLFLEKRVKFYLADGTLHPGGNAGAPSCLIAWGIKNRNKLLKIAKYEIIKGAFLDRAIFAK